MENNIQELIQKMGERKNFKTFLAKINKEIRSLEKEIQTWMEDSGRESLVYNGVNINLHQKKIVQKMKKEDLINKLKEKYGNVKDLEEILDDSDNFITKTILKVEKEN